MTGKICFAMFLRWRKPDWVSLEISDSKSVLVKNDNKVLSKCFDVAGKGGNVLTDLVRESVEHENISFTDTEMEQREGFAEV